MHSLSLEASANTFRARRRWAPIITLLLLSPFLAEVVFGATPLSNIVAFVPDIAVYGCGALLIRDVVRRLGLGWPSILLLGVAYGVVEEGIALGSLFNPKLFDAGELGARVAGVNWVWTGWTLGYHAVWSIALPILLAELFYPLRRDEPWLSRWGIGLAGGIYLLGVGALAAIFRLVITPDFSPTLSQLLCSLVVVGALAMLALSWPRASRGSVGLSSSSGVPSPWLVGLGAFLWGLAWFLPIMHVPHILRSGAWSICLIAWQIILVAVSVSVMEKWTARTDWEDLHQLALACGLLLSSALYGGLFVLSGASLLDRTGQFVASLVALGLLARLATRLRGSNRVIQDE